MTRIDASMEHELARVDALWNQEMYEDGLNLLESIISREPGFGKAHAYMGWYAYAQTGDYNTAANHYRLAMKFNAEFAGIYPNYAIVLFELRDFQASIDVARKGMNVAGTDRAQLMGMVGRALETMRALRSAKSAYREAFLISENHEYMNAMRASMDRVRRKRRMVFYGLLN